MSLDLIVFTKCGTWFSKIDISDSEKSPTPRSSGAKTVFSQNQKLPSLNHLRLLCENSTLEGPDLATCPKAR
jgi:hypothetical protein